MGRGPAKNQTLIRFRAPDNLRMRLERILERRGHGDLSELIRNVLYDYVEAEEHRLRITDAPHFNEEQHSLRVAEEPPVKSSPNKPVPKRASGK